MHILLLFLFLLWENRIFIILFNNCFCSSDERNLCDIDYCYDFHQLCSTLKSCLNKFFSHIRGQESWKFKRIIWIKTRIIPTLFSFIMVILSCTWSSQYLSRGKIEQSRLLDWIQENQRVLKVEVSLTCPYARVRKRKDKIRLEIYSWWIRRSDNDILWYLRFR